MKLVSVNIEGDKHLPLVRALLEKEMPDVVCMCEVFEDDAKKFAEQLGYAYVFSAKMSNSPWDFTKEVAIGVALFAPKIFDVSVERLWGEGDVVPHADFSTDLRVEPYLEHVPAIIASVEWGGGVQRFALTHLSVTAHGDSAKYQITQAERLLTALQKEQSVIICGDFNAPRGNKTFSLFADKYKDAIPAHYESSLDPVLFRKPGIHLMVDTLFHTPDIICSDVRLQPGVSDHMAVIATIK